MLLNVLDDTANRRIEQFHVLFLIGVSPPPCTDSDDRLRYLPINLPPQLPPFPALDLGRWFGRSQRQSIKRENEPDGKLRHWRQPPGKGLRGRAAICLHHTQRKAFAEPLRASNVGEVCRAGGDNQDISPHTLRHSFVTDLYWETGKIRLVQKVLRHANLSTTMIYTHIFDEEVEEALKSFAEKR